MKTIGVSAVSNTGVSVVSSMSRLEKFFGPGKWTISPFQQLEHISPRSNGWSHALTKHSSAFSSGANCLYSHLTGKTAVQWLQKIFKTSRYNNNSTSLRLSFNSFQPINSTNWAILYYLKLQLYTYCCSNSVSCVAYRHLPWNDIVEFSFLLTAPTFLQTVCKWPNFLSSLYHPKYTRYSVHLTCGKRIINVLPTAGIWISKQRFCEMQEMYDG